MKTLKNKYSCFLVNFKETLPLHLRICALHSLERRNNVLRSKFQRIYSLKLVTSIDTHRNPANYKDLLTLHHFKWFIISVFVTNFIEMVQYCFLPWWCYSTSPQHTSSSLRECVSRPYRSSLPAGLPGYIPYPYLSNPPLRQDMTQAQFLSGV